MNPFPTMHGTMYKEPNTIQECLSIRCDECAYSLQRVKIGLCWDCMHFRLLNGD